MVQHPIPLEYYKRDQQSLTGLMKHCDCKQINWVIWSQSPNTKYRLNSRGAQPAASANTSQGAALFYYRDMWNPSASEQSNSQQQQQLESARIGGGGSSVGGSSITRIGKIKEVG
ncbi:hypothetical protein Pyn_14411 [Prunus yedoensis var. nudiflora]|uniref:Uncharacterized protein n=1 Tax=Prunus yedoensis var. nudiflora TaxID=2094558 RepID=A0A314UPH6_PRUYE|nr:hypothetical protein Pyn_14411 [Prunus yedoensis var. nudiflora]